MKKELLIIVSTHGDEKIGMEVIKELMRKKLDIFFDFLVANPRAFELKRRFVEKDLNRSYPGRRYSKYYERRMAYKNIMIAKKYKYVIDIHEASSGMDDFIIVPKKRFPKKFPLDYVSLDKLLLWPDPKGPISQVLENSVELEFGAKNRDRRSMIKKTACIIENFIKNINNNGGKISRNKKIFYVYGLLMKDDFRKNKELVDFRKTEVNGEKFLPLLVNQYADLGIVCYKMKSL